MKQEIGEITTGTGPTVPVLRKVSQEDFPPFLPCDFSGFDRYAPLYSSRKAGRSLLYCCPKT